MNITPIKYTFNKTAWTIQCSDFTYIEKIALITNVTTNEIIYQFNNPAKWGTLSWNTLTLDYIWASINDNDKLSIIINTDVVSSKTSTSWDESVIVQPKQTDTWAWSFADTVASGVDTTQWTVLLTGTGMAVSQSAWNLLITTGITTYSETVIRSLTTIDARFRFEYLMQLSQRIVNQNFAIELTDILGDSLAFTINSTTSITVTKTAHGIDATKDIWKTISICSIVGASALPQLATIASVPTVNTITLTVTAFPASGSGTCTLYGLNMYQVVYNGATATALWGGIITNRKWRANTATASTISTTASPGHIGIFDSSKPFDFSYIDQTPATSTGIQATVRATINQNIPDDDIPLYIQIRVFNGSTAPASTSTMTLGFLRYELTNPLMVNIAWVQPQGFKNSISATVSNSLAVGTVTTVTWVTAVSAVTSSNLWKPNTIADVASAALTTTTTTATFTPTYGTSYVVSIPVTVVTGTNPTLDIVIQETFDGTNWEDVYLFQRITGTGTFNSPMLKLSGIWVRYVQTVGGTTPSFTRSIGRIQSSSTTPTIRQRIDRSIVLTTLNSTTGTFITRGCTKLSIAVNCGTMTTAPVLTFEGSNDNANWFNIASGNATFTPVASTVNNYILWGVTPLQAQYVRVRVSTAGTTATLNDITLTAQE